MLLSLSAIHLTLLAAWAVLGWGKKYNSYNKHAEHTHKTHGRLSDGAQSCLDLGGLLANSGHKVCCPAKCGVCGGRHCGLQWPSGSSEKCCVKRIKKAARWHPKGEFGATLPCIIDDSDGDGGGDHEVKQAVGFGAGGFVYGRGDTSRGGGGGG